VKSKLEKPKTLRQLASRHWAEIERGTLLFDRQQREAAALRELTKQDVTAFFKVSCMEMRSDSPASCSNMTLARCASVGDQHPRMHAHVALCRPCRLVVVHQDMSHHCSSL